MLLASGAGTGILNHQRMPPLDFSQAVNIPTIVQLFAFMQEKDKILAIGKPQRGSIIIPPLLPKVLSGSLPPTTPLPAIPTGPNPGGNASSLFTALSLQDVCFAVMDQVREMIARLIFEMFQLLQCVASLCAICRRNDVAALVDLVKEHEGKHLIFTMLEHISFLFRL